MLALVRQITTLLAVCTSVLALPTCGTEPTVVVVPSTPSTQSGRTMDAFLSYSIEFSSFVDFAGNTSLPNTFSDNLLNNIGHFTGIKPYIRVGGNTQDYALFNASQEVAIIGIFIPSVSTDYPRIVTIGPTFYDSFHTWPDVKYIYGFNLADNSTEGRQSLLATAQYACTALEDGLLAYWELGNEPDLYSTSAQGPRRSLAWKEPDYVTEWLNGTRAIKAAMSQYCPSLAVNDTYQYYAPSFGGTSNHLNIVTTWKDGLNADANIGLITSHNYIGGAKQPGVTLQGTLMNHTTNVNSVNKQLIEARSLYQLTSVPFILGETNSLYNEGAPGLSDSFGAALWALDFALYSAAGGIGRVHFHQGTNYRYQSWQPIDTNITTKGTKAPYYGNIAAAAFVGRAGSVVANVPLPGTTQAAYVVYRDDQLEKVMLINMLAFNTTGFGDGNQTRPAFDYQVHLPSCCEGTKVKLQRLMANGSDAISGVTFDGFSFNYELDGGKPVLMTNTTRGEEAVVQGGVVDVTVVASSAVMLVLDCDG